MTTPEEIAARREAYEDDADNVRAEMRAIIRSPRRALARIRAVERKCVELRAENAMLRACRETEQNALGVALPIVAAATEGPRLYLEPDGYGEPTVWHDMDGTPEPVLAKSDLAVGSRHLWDVVAARLTAGSET